jgi:hypothetical protein
MKRLISVLAATAVAAAVAAAITLPAGADAPAPDEPDATFVACLRAHGVGIPADARGDAIKAWIVAHDTDSAVTGAVAPCKAKAAGGDSPPDLVACLRDHGLNPPGAIDELKPWVLGQLKSDAGRAAVHACGIAQGPTDRKPADAPEKQAAICGGNPAPTAKPDKTGTPKLQDQ